MSSNKCISLCSHFTLSPSLLNTLSLSLSLSLSHWLSLSHPLSCSLFLHLSCPSPLFRHLPTYIRPTVPHSLSFFTFSFLLSLDLSHSQSHPSLIAPQSHFLAFSPSLIAPHSHSLAPSPSLIAPQSHSLALSPSLLRRGLRSLLGRTNRSRYKKVSLSLSLLSLDQHFGEKATFVNFRLVSSLADSRETVASKQSCHRKPEVQDGADDRRHLPDGRDGAEELVHQPDHRQGELHLWR